MKHCVYNSINPTTEEGWLALSYQHVVTDRRLSAATGAVINRVFSTEVYMHRYIYLYFFTKPTTTEEGWLALSYQQVVTDRRLSAATGAVINVSFYRSLHAPLHLYFFTKPTTTERQVVTDRRLSAATGAVINRVFSTEVYMHRYIYLYFFTKPTTTEEGWLALSYQQVVTDRRLSAATGAVINRVFSTEVYMHRYIYLYFFTKPTTTEEGWLALSYQQVVTDRRLSAATGAVINRVFSTEVYMHRYIYLYFFTKPTTTEEGWLTLSYQQVVTDRRLSAATGAVINRVFSTEVYMHRYIYLYFFTKPTTTEEGWLALSYQQVVTDRRLSAATGAVINRVFSTEVYMHRYIYLYFFTKPTTTEEGWLALSYQQVVTDRRLSAATGAVINRVFSTEVYMHRYIYLYFFTKPTTTEEGWLALSYQQVVTDRRLSAATGAVINRVFSTEEGWLALSYQQVVTDRRLSAVTGAVINRVFSTEVYMHRYIYLYFFTKPTTTEEGWLTLSYQQVVTDRRLSAATGAVINRVFSTEVYMHRYI
ncbi:hypothetical protein J6590_047570 [Homalodisca vitripennis]|nr:hypothetical protein J6590_047570 [Homalodisca vitripennis]